MRRDALIEQARQLRAEGLYYHEIAEKLDKSERTVRRWLHGESDKPRQRHKEWPTESRWPTEWTVESLSDLDNFDRGAWEGNLALIDTAERGGNYHLGWAFRRLVERSRDKGGTSESFPWDLAVACLLPIGAKLGCEQPCVDLAGLIDKHRPWESGALRNRAQRTAYLREAKEDASTILTCVQLAQAQYVLRDLTDDTLRQAPMWLAAFARRVPDFGRAPRLSIYGAFPLARVLLSTLAIPALGEEPR